MSGLHKLLIEHLLYPAMEKKNGNRIRPLTRELEAACAMTPDTLAARQREALTALLTYCRENVPAYRDLPPVTGDPVAYLRDHVAPLTKQAFRAHADDYLSTAIPQAQRIANRTGGSTGEPLPFYMTRDQVERYEAARWRGLSWFGITPGSRSIMIWGNPIELQQAAQKQYLRRERLLKNRRFISAYDLSPSRVDDYIQLLNRYKPEYFYGYATALEAFARMVAPKKQQLRIHLKAVVSTSETLYPHQRDLLAEVFSCPVVNEYGARDAGILAYTCPQGGQHLTVENAFFEVLDPVTLAPLPDGESGVLAVTDLHNRVQPRLRYLLGDVLSFSTAPCPCGRPQPILQSLAGREDALLVGPGGTLIHGHAINQLMRRYDEVQRFQIVQHTPDTATLYIVGGDIPLDRILAEIGNLLPNVTVTPKLVDAIPPAASGKTRYSIREFPLT